MKVVNGKPAISYCDATNSQLKYIIANDVNGTTWGNSITVDANTIGQFNSLAVIEGHPAISYYEDGFLSDYKNLKYVRANDSTGVSWGVIQVLDSEGTVGMFNNLIELNNGAGISYYDETEQWPKYIGGGTTCIPVLTATQPFGCTSYTSPSGLYTYTDDGIYYDTLTTVNGCDSIIVMDVSIGFSYGISLSLEDFSVLDISGTYQWLDCNNNYAIIPGATDSIFYIQAIGSYAVEVTYQGCADTSACYGATQILVGINQTDPNKLTLYPNPNSGIFSIELSENSSMIITDAIGKVVLEEQLYAGKNEIDFSKEVQGIYFVKLNNNNNQRVLKMMVNH
jgi:hypothetical protein